MLGYTARANDVERTFLDFGENDQYNSYFFYDALKRTLYYMVLFIGNDIRLSHDSK